METTQRLSAQEFADEFINDLQEDAMNINEEKFMFSWQVYNDDPNLTILKSKLNKIGYDLILINEANTITKLSWQVVKL